MTPLPGYCIVRENDSDTTEAGVVIPISAQDTAATVVYTSDCYFIGGFRYDSPVKPGDVVLLAPGVPSMTHSKLPPGHAIVKLEHVVCTL